MQNFLAKKLLIFVIVGLIAGSGIYQIYSHKNFEFQFVLGPGVTAVEKLSKYHPNLEGTAGDTDVIIMEGAEPGATMLLLGGTHVDEVACQIVALMFVENVVVEKGTLIVMPMNNNSAARITRAGEGHIPFFSIPTEWGEKTFRYGNRSTSEADQWPDPEVYFHYPSRQMLADAEIRNTNRTWPGRADGTLTEQINFAVTELMIAKNVDFAVDLHQAATMFPVNNCIIAMEGPSMDTAIMASALIRREDGFIRPVEGSPPLYRGLFSREIPEYLPNVMAFLMEVPIPFCDIMTGPKTEELLLTGKDPLLLRLAEAGRLYASYDERGWPLSEAVGQHNSSLLRLTEAYNMTNPLNSIILTNVPTLENIRENGMGYYIANPADNLDRVLVN